MNSSSNIEGRHLKCKVGNRPLEHSFSICKGERSRTPQVRHRRFLDGEACRCYFVPGLNVLKNCLPGCLISCRFLVGFSEFFAAKSDKLCRYRTFFTGACIESLYETLLYPCRLLSDAAKILRIRQDITITLLGFGELSLKTYTT